MNQQKNNKDQSILKCPRCHLRLKSTKTEEFNVIHICKQCWGIWLDGYDTGYAGHTGRLPDPDDRFPSEFDCPRCNGSVKELWYTTKFGKLIIDQCQDCNGIWLDNKKELTSLRNLNQIKHKNNSSLSDLQEKTHLRDSPAFSKLLIVETISIIQEEYFPEQSNNTDEMDNLFKNAYFARVSKNQLIGDLKNGHRRILNYKQWITYQIKEHPVLFVIILIVFFIILNLIGAFLENLQRVNSMMDAIEGHKDFY